jgi:cell division transport system permease protein
VLTVLEQTPGVDSARALSDDEQRALLEPWFGPDLPVADLPVPRLIEVIETPEGYDAAGLRQRLAAEAPGPVLDDHTRWRRRWSRPRTACACWAGVAGADPWLDRRDDHPGGAGGACLQRTGDPVMRLVGARDTYIARAFVRRFTRRALTGAAVGTVAGHARRGASAPRRRGRRLPDRPRLSGRGLAGAACSSRRWRRDRLLGHAHRRLSHA